MHALEHLLFILAMRLRQAGNDELADAAGMLAGASHNYEPVTMADGSNADDVLAAMNTEWSQRFLPPVMEYQRLYVIQATDTGFMKIGIARDPDDRLRTLQTGSPHPLALVHVRHGESVEDAMELERRVHDLLSQHRCRSNGEWFAVTLDQVTTAIDQASAAATQQRFQPISDSLDRILT